jgi:hypothetical protein
MANGAFKFKDNSGNVVSFISGSGPNISFSGGTLDLSGMTGLTLGNLTLSGTTQNAQTASFAPSYLLTSSFNSYTGTTNASSRLTSIESLTGSYATTGSNLFKGNQTFSGSLIPSVNGTYDLGSETNQFRHLYLSSASLYIDGTKVLGSTTQELQITTDTGQSFKILEAGSDTITLQSNDGNITLATSGGGDVIMDPTNGVIGLKGTVTIYTGNKILSSDGNSIQFGNGIAVTGSIVSTVTPLVSGSSQISYTGLSNVPSGLISSSAQVTGFGFATTGSNAFMGTQTITGSLYISSDLVVQGSSSLQNITASAVNIGANIVNLNTANPAIRFAGLSIFDSGSIGGSGSFLYDAVQDEFIFIHRGDGTNITSSVVLMGPQTYNNVGSESYPTTNKLLKGTGNEHIGDSIVTETDGGIGISGSLSITGSIVASGTSLISGSSQVDVMSTINIARLATTGSNIFIGNQVVTGSVSITGSINVTGSLLTTGSSVGIGGQANPARTLHVMGQGAFDMTHAGVVIQDSISPITASQIVSYKQTNAVGSAYRNMHLRADVLGIAIMSGSGYISIGKDSANSMLDVNGNALVSGSLTTTGNLSINSTSTTQLNIYTSSISTQNVMGEFWNGDYTSNTRNFIRVRNAVNAGSTMSSYFGQGQDGKTYIISNDFTKNHIVIDGNSTFVGINKNTPNTQLDVNGNTTVTGSLVTTSNVTIGTTNAGQPTMYLTRVGGFPTIKGSTVNGGDGQIVIDGASNSSNVYLNNYVSSNVYLATGGGTTHSGLLIPHTNATYDLGSSANRWSTVYTSDLSMSNGIGDYTIVEGLEDLFLYNNKTNKVFKFMLQEVDPSTATPKKS